MAPTPIGRWYSPVRWNSPVSRPETGQSSSSNACRRAVELPPGDTKSRVDFLAAVAPRIAEREQAFGADFRVIVAHEPVANRHVTVLDDDLRLAIAPDGVPRAEILAAEDALDLRAPDRSGHVAVELATAAKRDRAGARSKVGEKCRRALRRFPASRALVT